MNLSRGQAGYNTNNYEQYQFTLIARIPVENHDSIVSHTKLIAKRDTMLLARKQNLKHLRKLGIHTLQHVQKTVSVILWKKKNIFLFFLGN